MMENENNGSISSSPAQNAVKKVKEYVTSGRRRPVGGQIHDYELWEDFKQRCVDYGIAVTPDGLEHLLRLADIIDPVFFPIAKASGLTIIRFTEERIGKLVEVIKNNKDWIDETEHLHNNIISKTDKNLALQIKKK